MTPEQYLSGRVVRYHARPTVREKQTVADHQWGVAMLILHANPQATLRGIFAALTHDMAESIFGDVPWPAKQLFPGLEEAEARARVEQMGLPDIQISEEEERWLRWADRTEALIFMGLQGVIWERDELDAAINLAPNPLARVTTLNYAKALHDYVQSH